MEIFFTENNTVTKEQLIEVTKVLMNQINKNEEKITEQEKQIQVLKEQTATKDEIISNRDFIIKQLQLILSNKNRDLYGKSSEKVNVNQLCLFNEPETILRDSKQPAVRRETEKKQKKLNEQVKENVTDTVEYKEDMTCTECNSQMREFKHDTNYTVEIIPASVKITENKIYSYKCDCCEEIKDKTIIKKAKGPDQLIPKSVTSPSLMSYIINDKYKNHMPLDRIEKKCSEQIGFDISKQTMSNWMRDVTKMYLSKVFDRLLQQFNDCSIVHGDETPITVVKSSKNDKSKSIQGYMWAATTGKFEDNQIAIFRYSNNRRHENAKLLFKDFKGYLHSDGYEAYTHVNDVTLIGCLAHVRRGYEKALSHIPDDKKLQSHEYMGVDFCNRLFALDEKRPTDILEQRKLILDEFKEWLDVICLTTRKGSPLAKAITYTFNQWEKIYNITLNEKLEVSNNRCERLIRPFAIGRKNWLFYYTDAGANIGSIIYSIVQTANLNNLNVYKYLEYLFKEMSKSDYTDDMLDDLLPTSKNLPSFIRK